MKTEKLTQEQLDVIISNERKKDFNEIADALEILVEEMYDKTKKFRYFKPEKRGYYR